MAFQFKAITSQNLNKDICDRIISPLKSSIRKYCNEGHDILNAMDMHSASSSVNETDESVEQLKVKKVENFSSYHNFTYEKDGIKAWRVFGVAKGKKVINKSFYVSHQHKDLSKAALLGQ